MDMKKRNIILVIIFVFATLLSFYYDSEIMKAVSLLRNNYFTDFFMGIAFVSSAVIIFFFLTSLFLWREHKRKWILPLWLMLLFSVIMSYLLKILIQRPRPFQIDASIVPLIIQENFSTWNFSFPSFQSVLVFSAVPILSKEFPKFKYIWIIFAALVAFSRVYLGVHFLSDIIAGGIIGYFIGAVVVKLEKDTRLWEKLYKKIF